MVIAKFGQLNHLQELIDGKIYFNSVKNYRDDGTDYRGDFMEGKYFIDPSTFEILDENGNNILKNLPKPERIIASSVNDDNMLMFCAAKIDFNVLTKIDENKYVFTEDFKNAVKNFGDYVLVINDVDSFISNINEHTSYTTNYRPIKYIDIRDFENLYEAYQSDNPFIKYFIKDLQYKNQNEWRMLLENPNNDIQVNDNGGYIVNTLPLENVSIYRTEGFLKTIFFTQDKRT